ncbi:alpha/beta hydrolase [Nocardia uniformis]|uniref:Alpha/beta hydrolase n=1 Tax=Nocardia uniformis TaxID=53432 RepID=A0A849BNW1_9NOCA|nr:alpha/beta hydrolase [Nocardia uniformis]NNH68402.1 alpha/beta hydrolase [Nocardia uniformis]
MNESVLQWGRRGRYLSVGPHQIFVVEMGASGPPPLVVVHGFPGSSHDFAAVAQQLSHQRPVVLLDLLGFGFSDKPRTARYSLFEQADLVEAVLSQLGIDRCAVLAHDMGDTVVAELLYRHNTGELGFTPEQVILTNGSIFIDLAQLTLGQRAMLRLPAAALPFPLPARILSRALEQSFTPAAPPPPDAIESLIELIQLRGGACLLPRQNRYILERREHQSRWTAGLVDYTGPLLLVWGAHDPIAITAMPERLQQLRPKTRVVILADIGHWPSLEAPQVLADHISEHLHP